MPKEKPWLSSREQVVQLKQKGVSFQLMSEADAQSYLSENNTYFRIRSYRTNFAKHASGAYAARRQRSSKRLRAQHAY